MQKEAAAGRAENFLADDSVQAYEFRAVIRDVVLKTISDGQILPRHVRELAKTSNGLFSGGSVEGALTLSGRWYPVAKPGCTLLFARVVDWETITGHGPIFVAFTVTVTRSTDTETEQWQIRRRYRQFHALHEMLKFEQHQTRQADPTAVATTLPELPAKRALGRWLWGHGEGFVEERRRGLGAYLDALCCTCDASPALLFFLEADPPSRDKRAALRAASRAQEEWSERLLEQQQALRGAREERGALKAKLKDERDTSLELRRKLEAWQKELAVLEPKRVQQHGLLLHANRRLAHQTPPRSQRSSHDNDDPDPQDPTPLQHREGHAEGAQGGGLGEQEGGTGGGGGEQEEEEEEEEYDGAVEAYEASVAAGMREGHRREGAAAEGVPQGGGRPPHSGSRGEREGREGGAAGSGAEEGGGAGEGRGGAEEIAAKVKTLESLLEAQQSTLEGLGEVRKQIEAKLEGDGGREGRRGGGHGRRGDGEEGRGCSGEGGGAAGSAGLGGRGESSLREAERAGRGEEGSQRSEGEGGVGSEEESEEEEGAGEGGAAGEGARGGGESGEALLSEEASLLSEALYSALRGGR